MFTVCSKCNLRLIVTAADLRAAQGYVRCGHCHNVFNSLAALADDPAPPAEQAAVADTQRRPILTPPEPPAPEPSAPEATVDDAAAEKPAADEPPADASPPDTSAADTSAPDTSMEFNPASTSINEVFIEAGPGESTGTFESIVLSGEAPEDVDATSVDEVEFMSTWAFAAAAEAAPEAVPEEAPQEAPDAALLISGPAASRSARWAMHGCAWALALCLIAQVVHHYRGELADTSLLHRPLTAIYQAVGLPLQPRWDIANYEIRQLGAIVDGAAADDLVVRASISNHATRDQPLPLLRVVMQDRFGNRVAARDLEPAEYLARGAPRLSLMAPGQRVDAQVAFRDPGQAATGFEIDACMAGHDRSVTCTNDPGSH